MMEKRKEMSEDFKNSKEWKFQERFLDFSTKLDQFFEEYRIYGDKRDLDNFKPKDHESSPIMCMIFKESPFLRLIKAKRPEDVKIFTDLDNVISLCTKCVISYIKLFIKYRKTHKDIPFDKKRGYIPPIEEWNSFLIEDPKYREYGKIKWKTKEYTKKLGEATQEIFKGKFEVGDLVKVKFTALNEKQEYMWVRILKKKNKTTYIGHLGNQPFFKHKDNLKEHDIVEIRSKDIYDKHFDD